MKKSGPTWLIIILVVLNVMTAYLAFNSSVQLETSNKVKTKENSKTDIVVILQVKKVKR